MALLKRLAALLKINTEPVTWIGVLLIVLHIVQAILTNMSAGRTFIDSVVIAVGAIIARQSVTPNAKAQRSNMELPPIK